MFICILETPPPFPYPLTFYLVYRFGSVVLMLERFVVVQLSLKRAAASEKWVQWRDKLPAADKKKALVLEGMAFDRNPNCFFSRAEQVLNVLLPALVLLRALESNLPHIHLVYFLMSQVTLVCACDVKS